MTVNSAFTVNGATPTDAIAVAAGSTVTLALLSTSGINGVVWSIVGNDNRARTNPTITVAGSPQGATASFVMPADAGDGLGQAYRVQCAVSDGGSPANTSTTVAVVGIANVNDVVPFAYGEDLDRHAIYGWTETLNRSLAAPGLNAGLGPYATDTQRTAESITVADFGKFAFQYDTGGLWVVGPVAATGGASVEWKSITGSSTSFAGDFSTLLSGLTVYNYWQPDLRLVEDTTLRQTSGSTAVLTLSGTRTGAPTSIIVTCPTTGGARGTWQGVVTYIDGTTQSFASAATVALTGRGAGLTLNIAAGTVATGNTWKACAATLTDSVAGFSLASDGPTFSPLITIGINGMAGVETNGTTWLHNNSCDLPATPFTLIAVVRRTAIPGSNAVLFGGDTGFFGSVRSLTTDVDMYDGSPGPACTNTGLTANTWGFLIANFSGTGADYLKFGSAAAVGPGNAGSTNPATGRSLGALISGTFGCSAEFLFGAWVAGGTPTNIATIKAGITSRYGAGIPV